MGVNLLKTISLKIESKQDSIFTYPVNRQRAYIASLGTPRDELERGYFQFLCQMKLYGGLLATVLNIAALPVSLAYLFKAKSSAAEPTEQSDCIFVNNGLPENIVPNSLKEQYGVIKAVSSQNRCLDEQDLAFLKTLFKRYPFSWLLWLKVIYKLSSYSYVIKQYQPKALLCCDEFSFTSSIMTSYCRSKGVKLINVMHGEKLYFMRDAFVCYDQYFVWDSYYAKLLIDMGADKDQFQIEQPDSLIIRDPVDSPKLYDYTYYLAAEDEAVLKKIAESLQALSDKGMRISVRPHPRYSDMSLVEKIFTFADIEDTGTLTIQQSLLQTHAAISLYSTVLTQAICNQIPIVIDDISNPTHFAKLKELQYVCLNKEHKLLSQVVEGTL